MEFDVVMLSISMPYPVMNDTARSASRLSGRSGPRLPMRFSAPNGEADSSDAVSEARLALNSG